MTKTVKILGTTYKVRLAVPYDKDPDLKGKFGYPIYLGLTIAGSDKGSATVKSAAPYQWSSAITYTSPWYTVSNKTTGTTAVTFKMYSGLGSTRSETYSYSMAIDPAGSVVKASNGTLGTPLTLTVTRYNTAYTHTITYTCGNKTGTICTKSSAETVTWNADTGNTLTLASQNTTGTSVTVQFTITTYNGSTAFIESRTTVTMAIPDGVKPSVALAVEDAAGYLATYGAYVQGWSKLKLTATPTLAYDSPIKTYAITADGKTYDSTPVTTGAIQGKGTLTLTAKVTDSRERPSEVVSKTITVLEYYKPSVTAVAYRCNSSGAADPEGAYMRVGFTSAIASLNSKNTATYTITYSSAAGSGTLTGSGTSFTSNAIACDVSRVWSIEVKVTDKFDSTTASAVIPIAFTLMDFYNTGKGIAFGKVATRDGFDCAMDAYFTGGVSINGKSLLNLIYPVGSIYMSVNNVSPATLLGGTWEQIKDRFLLAAGTTYSAGATGGEAAHTLSVSELPAHGHHAADSANTGNVYTTKKEFVASGAYAARLDATYGYVDTSNTTYRLSTTPTGDGAAHNNMPPYLAVYVWKRTA